jgi:GAF domain-containing protein
MVVSTTVNGAGFGGALGLLLEQAAAAVANIKSPAKGWFMAGILPAPIIRVVPKWARLITAGASIRVATAMVLYLSGSYSLVDPPPLPWGLYAALAIVFGAIGVALTVVNKHDARAAWLGGMFVLVAAALTAPFFKDRPIDEFGWLWFFQPEALLPAFLWRFGSEFPSPLVGRSAQVFRAVARTAVVAGSLIALANLLFIFWPETVRGVLGLLLRPPLTTRDSLYYPVLYGLEAASFGALIWRASRGRPDERRRLMLFAIGIAAGSAPLVIQVLLESIPSYYAFTHSPQRERYVGALLFGALACIPFITAYSVLFDHIVELRVALRAALQYALARYTIIMASSLPLAALVVVIYRERAQPLEAFAIGARPLLLGGTAALGLMTLRARHRLIALLDRRYFREPYDTRQLVDRLMSDALHATTPANLELRLRAAIAGAMHAELSLFIPDASGSWFTDTDGLRPIDASGLLVSLVSTDEAAMDVDPSDQRSPFRRLPADEQRWLLAAGVILIVPLHAPDRRLAGMITLTPKRSGLTYSTDDRRFLTAAAASASLALDNLRLRSSSSDVSQRPARECQSCSKLNDPDAKVCVCGGVVTVSAAPHTLRGIYRLDHRIGAGGMGVVYLARDLNLDRPVAIKTLPTVSAEHSARLRIEARAMAAVQHPNLAVIHGIETWQGTPFLVQEFLAGGTLADRLRSGPMAISDAISLCSTIAEALDHLHAAGIVHRDVKPSNIGFTEREVPKLLDFGLAKLPKLVAANAETDAGTATQAAVAFGDTTVHGGTPAYMSPEALDAAVPARPALDLWALGVVLFESITGRRPFGGATRAEIRAAASGGLRAAASEFNPQVPPDVDRYLQQILHAHPSQRPARARDVRAELERLRIAMPAH